MLTVKRKELALTQKPDFMFYIKQMEKDKQKLGWGGKRPNQHGRPKLPTEERRVYLGVRIKPETKAFLEEDKQSQGSAIDKLVVRAKAKKI
tara:strand:+ start:258 stop:530 length:273 start_codon:yes stop_codon:yes gene_type:complete